MRTNGKSKKHILFKFLNKPNIPISCVFYNLISKYITLPFCRLMKRSN